jgi:hypothetical protein
VRQLARQQEPAAADEHDVDDQRDQVAEVAVPPGEGAELHGDHRQEERDEQQADPSGPSCAPRARTRARRARA